jgi:anti-sigma regulatory factor (Ser/Thr protein kinase)/serine/threonine protein phosphatase PrpC
MQSPAAETLAIGHSSDVPAARRATKALAEQLGFDSQTSDEIGLATSELASNLIKHASGGSLRLTPLVEADRRGIEIESLDKGPGIADAHLALTDGFSTAASLGYGLGAVNRMMDHLEIDRRTGGGTHIVCRRWLREQVAGPCECPLQFGVATRARAGMSVNGDSFVVKRWRGAALAGVIDGLGHGQFAHRAAEAARSYVEGHYDQPMAAIFRGTERACRATRGVVMALARFDWPALRMTFASIGNVEARMFRADEPAHLHNRRGVLGGSSPSPVVIEQGWQSGTVLVLHSDGLHTGWKWQDFPDAADQPPASIAQRMLNTLAKDEDDATVIVVREDRP